MKQMIEKSYTTIRISIQTKNRIEKYAKYKDTPNTIITRILTEYEELKKQHKHGGKK